MLRTHRLTRGVAILAASVLAALTSAGVAVSSEDAGPTPEADTPSVEVTPDDDTPMRPHTPTFFGIPLSTAAACWEWVEVSPGQHEYVYICELPDDDGDDGDDEWVGPSCDLSHDPWNEYCKGKLACRADIPSSVPRENWPDRPAHVDPGKIYTWVECIRPPDEDAEGGYDWVFPYHDSLPEEAYGRLQTPAFTLEFDPKTLTYVGADTTFSVDGVGDGELVGSPAGPLQAFGTLSKIEIKPGDGSGIITCDGDPKTEDCTHVYERTSHDQKRKDLDGRPAYAVQARLVYDVRYELNGDPYTIPGVPDTLESPWNGTLVPVGEIQSLVQ